MLPIAGAPAPVYADESLATQALRHYDRFLAETEAHTQEFLATAGTRSLAEAFRYQALITPRFRHPRPVVALLDHDWPAYLAGGGTGAPLRERPTSLRYLPPPYASLRDFASFASTHIGYIRARVEIGVVEELEPTPAVARVVA